MPSVEEKTGSSESRHEPKDGENKEESYTHFRIVMMNIRESMKELLGPRAHSGETVRRTFVDLDKNGDQLIDRDEFKAAMEELHVPVGWNEIESIYHKYSENDSDLNYHDFLALLDLTSSVDVDDMLRQVRTAVLEDLGPGSHCAARMKELFAEIDDNADGKINVDEFSTAMKMLHVPLGRKDIDVLFKRYDENDNGTIEYAEFIDMMGFQSRDEIVSILEDVRDTFNDAMTSNNAAAVRKLFADIDEDGDSRLSKLEFKKAMQTLKVPVGDTEIDKIFAVYDEEGSGNFNYYEFLLLLDWVKNPPAHSSETDNDISMEEKPRDNQQNLGLESTGGLDVEAAHEDEVESTPSKQARDLERSQAVSSPVSQQEATPSSRPSRPSNSPHPEGPVTNAQKGDAVDRRKVGDKIKAKMKSQPNFFYDGLITKVNEDGTYCIDFDGGDKEDDVPENNIIDRGENDEEEDELNVISSESKIGHEYEEEHSNKEEFERSIGSKQSRSPSAQSPSEKPLKPSMKPISEDPDINDKYNTEDTGSNETSTLERTAEVSKPPVASPQAEPSSKPEQVASSSSSSSSSSMPTYIIGDIIEGKYLDGREWLAGVIAGVNENGTYEIKYIDGEEESAVEISRIRAPSNALSPEEEEENRRWQAEEDETNRLLALEENEQTETLGDHQGRGEKDVHIDAEGGLEQKEMKGLDELPDILPVGILIEATSVHGKGKFFEPYTILRVQPSSNSYDLKHAKTGDKKRGVPRRCIRAIRPSTTEVSDDPDIKSVPKSDTILNDDSDQELRISPTIDRTKTVTLQNESIGGGGKVKEAAKTTSHDADAAANVEEEMENLRAHMLMEDHKALKAEIDKEKEAEIAANSAFTQSVHAALAKIQEAVELAAKYRDELSKSKNIDPDAASYTVAVSSEEGANKKPKKLTELVKGDRVEKKIKNKWCPGVVTDVKEDTVNINFDDGDMDEDVPKDYDHLRIEIKEYEKVTDQQVLTSAIALDAAKKTASSVEAVAVEDAVADYAIAANAEKECTALIDIVSPFTKLPMEKIYTIAKSLYLKSHEAYDLIKKFATTSREAAELPQKKAREQAELEKARLEEEAAAKAALEAEERLKNPKVSRWKRAPEGDRNGEPLLHEREASIMIQAAYRGKAVRKNNHRKNVCATFIQSAVRMALQGKAYKALLEATKRVKAEEEQRSIRLRRIQEREKELILLRSMPASDYFLLDKMRKDSAAKIIQRNIRKYLIAKFGVGKFGLTADSGVETEIKLQVNADTLYKSMLDQIDKQGKVYSEHDKGMDKLVSKIESDALGLAQLQRRVHDTARKKLRSGNKENVQGDMFKKAVSGYTGSVDDLGASVDLTATTKPKRRHATGRAKFQKMMELQHTCDVWRSEYCDSKAFMQATQGNRLKSLSHCRSLINQTKNLPSLEEAKAFLKNGSSGDKDLSWLLDDDLKKDDCDEAVRSHLRTIEVLTHSNRWNVIAPPHDLTGPPVDISTLPSVADHKGESIAEVNLNEVAKKQHKSMHRLASLWAAGEDAEESLWWVSYASALPVQHHAVDDKLKNYDNVEIKLGQASTDEDKARVQRMLGDVDGHKLLMEASKDFLKAKDRRAIAEQQVKQQRAKEIKIAQLLEKEASEARKRALATSALEQHTKHELEKRYNAAMKIQSRIRGHLSRKATANLMSEVRMLDAIRILLGELQGNSGNAAGGSGYAGAGAINKISNLKKFLTRTKANEVDFATHNTVHRPKSPQSTHKAMTPTVAALSMAKATPDVVRFQDTRQSKSQYKSTPKGSNITPKGALGASPFFNANLHGSADNKPESNEAALPDLYLAQPKFATNAEPSSGIKATPTAFGKSMPGVSSFEEVGITSFMYESHDADAGIRTASTGEGPSGFVSPPTRSSGGTNLDISAFSDEISQSKGAASPPHYSVGFSKATPPDMNHNDVTLDESAILGHDRNVLDSTDSKLPEIYLDNSPQRPFMARGGGGVKDVSQNETSIGIEGVGMAAFEHDMKAQEHWYH